MAKPIVLQSFSFLGVELRKLNDDKFIVSGQIDPPGWNEHDPNMGFVVRIQHKCMFTHETRTYVPFGKFNHIYSLGEIKIDFILTETCPESGLLKKDEESFEITYGGHAFVL